MNALVLKGPQWAVDSLAEDSMRNRDFWSKQEVECAVDIDTGITKWVFGGLTRCEPRTCLLLPTMLSANNILLEYNHTIHVTHFELYLSKFKLSLHEITTLFTHIYRTAQGI